MRCVKMSNFVRLLPKLGRVWSARAIFEQSTLSTSGGNVSNSFYTQSHNCRRFKTKVPPVSENIQRSGEILSVSAEIIMNKTEENLHNTEKKQPLSESIAEIDNELQSDAEKFSKNVEAIDDLLRNKVALDQSDTNVVFESEITDEELEDYLKRRQIEGVKTYGAKTDSVEQLTGTVRVASGGSVDDSTVYMYGTPDPTVPITNTPCAGCGALLHCHDPAIPGEMLLS